MNNDQTNLRWLLEQRHVPICLNGSLSRGKTIEIVKAFMKRNKQTKEQEMR